MLAVMHKDWCRYYYRKPQSILQIESSTNEIPTVTAETVVGCLAQLKRKGLPNVSDDVTLVTNVMHYIDYIQVIVRTCYHLKLAW